VSLLGSALPCSGHGEPLIYLPGGTPNHHNPPPGFQRQLTFRTVRPFARAGFEVFFTNRWPGMSIDITWPEVTAGHATALALGTGGGLGQ
jgi:hypothetical protein